MDISTRSSIALPAGSLAQADRESRVLRLNLHDGSGEHGITMNLILCLTQALESDDQSRLVVLEGAPGSFCSGYDLAQAISPRAARAMLERFAHLLELLTRTPRPVIALVDGAAMGGGVGLAAAADIVLATPRASFSLPETLMGLVPGVIFPYIARRLGVSRAKMLALGSRPLDAASALQFGLVDQVADDVETTLQQYAKRLSRTDSHATGALKALVADYYSPEVSYQREAIATFGRLAASESTQMRIERFLAGETPWS